MLRSGQIPSDKQKQFDQFFNEFALPQAFLSGGDDLRSERVRFHKNYLAKAQPGPARQRLLELATTNFKKILFDAKTLEKFSGDNKEKLTKWTAAKINVIYVLGELNETENSGALGGARASRHPRRWISC